MLNFQVFWDLKLCIKNKFIDQIVNNIQLERNFVLKKWTKVLEIAEKFVFVQDSSGNL